MVIEESQMLFLTFFGYKLRYLVYPQTAGVVQWVYLSRLLKIGGKIYEFCDRSKKLPGEPWGLEISKN